MRTDPDQINEKLENIKTSPIREKTLLSQLIKRPEIGFNELEELDEQIKAQFAKYNSEEKEQAEIHLKYESYIDREQKLAQKIESLENYSIKTDFDYDRVKALSAEGREKLKRIKPETLGQASRISGVSPADISILTIYMGK
jgi:tRNA uridine 5-carboxymethylaminomethyl modification enzyme